MAGSTESYSKSVGFAIEVGTKFTGGLFGLGSEASFMFKFNYQKTWTTGSSTGESQAASMPCGVPPRSAMRCSGIFYRARVDMDYTATIQIGNSVFKTSGVWRGTMVTGLKSSYKQLPMIKDDL